MYSAFKHAVQVMWTCKTDICIENLVRLRACHSFKKLFSVLGKKNKKKGKISETRLVLNLFCFRKKKKKHRKY